MASLFVSGRNYNHGDICGLYFNLPGRSDSFVQPQRHYLPQVQLQSHTTITPVCYTTILKQDFHNPSTQSISEARYCFPLYDGVAVCGYTIQYGDKTMKGVVKEKEKARKTYQDAIDQGQAAGLLKSLPAGIFGVTLGNIPAKTDVHVNITYCGELKHDAAVDGLRYMLPTSIAPRYGEYPGELAQSNTVDSYGISITVDIVMGKSAIRKVQSPSHPISVALGATSSQNSTAPFDAAKASATLTLNTAELAGDFILQLLIDDISRPQALIEQHSDLPSRAIMATLVPKFDLKIGHPEIVFIADQSGSMQGSKNEALISALKIFIKSLPIGIRFNICAFGSRFEFLWPKSQAYNEANMNVAMNFVAGLNASYGGTEMFAPVEATFEQRLGDLPLEVMLLTDGEIWNEEQLFGYINSELKGKSVDARVFALGIGDDVSHTLVEGVARAGNGFAQFVTQNEEADRKVVRMLKGALYPHTTDYKIEVAYEGDGVEDVSIDGDEFELIQEVDYKLNIKDRPLSSEPSAEETTEKAPASASKSGETPQPASFFDTSADVDRPIKSEDDEKYAHLPSVEPPKVIQAPNDIPALFPFNRSTLYLMLGEDTLRKQVKSVTLRAKSPQGPLELTISVTQSEQASTTVHTLAAKKVIQDLEEGRGWLQHAKTVKGESVADKHKSRFDELVEREAVRVGEKFQVAGKWTSFVAVEETPQGGMEIHRDSNDEAQVVHEQSVALFRTLRKCAVSSSAAPDKKKQSGGGRTKQTARLSRGGFAPLPSGEADALAHAQGAQAVAEKPTTTLHYLIHLQTFSGFWNWSDELFHVLKLDDAGQKPVYDGAFSSETVMATALAIAFFEIELAADENVWEMVVLKARTWMTTQVAPDVVGGLVTKAKELLNGMS